MLCVMLCGDVVVLCGWCVVSVVCGVCRLGQFKCISVVRFVIPNTIEERILQLQEKKHLLFNSTVGMDNDALARLSLQDLQFLFH